MAQQLIERMWMYFIGQYEYQQVEKCNTNSNQPIVANDPVYAKYKSSR